MKKFGAMFIALPLIAAAPSYGQNKKAKTERPNIKFTPTDLNTWFKGVKKHVIFINNLTGSDTPGGGTCANPYASLQYAEQNSKPNDVLYVVGTGTPYLLDSTVFLKNGQCLISSSVKIKLDDKEIPPFTPNQQPELQVSAFQAPGIAVANCNHVAGFLITGDADPYTGDTLGIGSSELGIGNRCRITKNHFTNLTQAINLYIQRLSTVDIECNQFSDISNNAIQLQPADQATSVVRKNAFQNIGNIAISSSGFTLPHLSASNEKNLPTLISSGGILIVEDNTFTTGARRAIDTQRLNTLKIYRNTSDFQQGFGSLASLNIDITNNSFTTGFIQGSSKKVEIKNNTFSWAPQSRNVGLEIVNVPGGTFCLEGNSFKNFPLYGLRVEAVPTDTLCLQLINNSGEDNGSYVEQDIFIKNFASTNSLFQVAVLKHPSTDPNLNAAKVSTNNNNATVTILDGTNTPNNDAVSYVKYCPGCSHSK